MTPDVPLSTARLVLRDFVPGDWAALHAWASDAAVTEPMDVRPFAIADAQGYVARMLASQAERPRRRWELAIVRRADGALVGACGLRVTRQRGTVGYVLGRAYWGLGYATEAGGALLAFGFDGLRLARVDATCARGHAASARVLAKLGLRRVRAPWWPPWAARRCWWFDLAGADWRRRSPRTVQPMAPRVGSASPAA